MVSSVCGRLRLAAVPVPPRQWDSEKLIVPHLFSLASDDDGAVRQVGQFLGAKPVPQRLRT